MTRKVSLNQAQTGKKSNQKEARQRNAKKSSGKFIEVVGTGRYPQLPTNRIEVVARPTDGENKVFFNPRGEDKFDPQLPSMKKLRYSIQVDELQEPISVCCITDPNGNVLRALLIAGQRRLHNVLYLIEEDAPCYSRDLPHPDDYEDGAYVVYKAQIAQVTGHDENGNLIVTYTDASDTQKTEAVTANVLKPTAPASEVYANIYCNIVYDADEATCLRLACTENGVVEPLTIAEEIALVERLTAMGYKQDEICEMTNQNITWVSQTGHFRDALPPAALEKLLAGKLTRNVAVTIMSYAPEDRQGLFEASVEAEAEETKEAIASLQQEQEQHEDIEDLARAAEKEALAKGDAAAAKKARRVAASAEGKAKKAKAKKSQVKEHAGQIQAGHVNKGAAKAGVNPKKAKMLTRPDLEEFWVKLLASLEDGQHLDEVTGQKIPKDHIKLMRATAIAIMAGNRDPISVLRKFLVEKGVWKLPTTVADDENIGDDVFTDDESSVDEDRVLEEEFGDRVTADEDDV